MDRDVFKIVINNKIISLLRPGMVVTYAVIVISVIFLIAPISIAEELDVYSIAYIISSLLLFLLGTLTLGNKILKYNLIVSVNKSVLKSIYRTTLLLGLFGILLRYFDLFVQRGLSIQNNTLENFDLISKGGGGIYSLLSNLTIHFIYIPTTLDFVVKKLNTRKVKIISLLLLLSTGMNAVLSGSRFAIITPMIYIFILALITGYLKVNLKFKNAMFLLIILGIFLLLISNLYIKRIHDMKMDVNMVLDGSTGGHSAKVPAKQEFIHYLHTKQDSWEYPFIFAFINISQYSTHPIFEFQTVKQYIDKKGEHLYGQATFNVFARVFYKFFSNNNISTKIRNLNARPGIWSTFFFTWYLDFGWFGIILMFLLGVISKWIWGNVYFRANILFLPVLIFMEIILFLILHLNYLAGLGSMAMFCFALIPIFVPKRKIIKNVTREYMYYSQDKY